MPGASDFPSASSSSSAGSTHDRASPANRQQQRDPGALARLEEVKRDEWAPRVIFARLADPDSPERLRDIAREWGLPRARFIEWFMTEHAALYEAALKVRAGELVLDALDHADAATSETAKAQALKVRTRLEIASHWDRQRYGKQETAVQVNFGEFAMQPTERLVETLNRLVERGQGRTVAEQPAQESGEETVI